MCATVNTKDSGATLIATCCIRICIGCCTGKGPVSDPCHLGLPKILSVAHQGRIYCGPYDCPYYEPMLREYETHAGSGLDVCGSSGLR